MSALSRSLDHLGTSDSRPHLESPRLINTFGRTDGASHLAEGSSENFKGAEVTAEWPSKTVEDAEMATDKHHK